MARIVEDSDDEFPDLAELLSNAKGNALSKTPLSRPSPRNQTERVDDELDFELTDQIYWRRDIEKASRNRKDKEEGEDLGEGKKRPGKRVLKQRAENPLLRPFSGRGVNIASSELTTNTMRSKNRVSMEENAIKKQTVTGWSKPTKILGSDDGQQGTGSDSAPSKKILWEGKVSRKVLEKNQSRPAARSESDGEGFALGSDGISGFIVNDSTCLEEDSIIEMLPPKSTRRLVKGRKTGRDEASDDELDLRMKKLNVKEDAQKPNQTTESMTKDSTASYSDHEALPRLSKKTKLLRVWESRTSRPDKGASSEIPPPSSSDIEDPFTLRYSPSESKPRKVSKGAPFITPPGSPELKPKKLKSPSKEFPQIPATPHRPSMDSFWSQDVINEWNDKFSPQKPLKSRRLDDSDSTGGTFLFSAKKSPARQGKTIGDAKKAFSEKKHALAESFLVELDNVLTDGQISELSASTGGIQIIWSKKLNTTAGRANWKREAIKSLRVIDGKAPPPTFRHHAAIELAEKVINDENRLLNVIAHEFCHLANFMISNIKTNPHGKEFKVWAANCSFHFRHRGIEVTTKHSYTIDYKYVWECENCGLEFKRHSKSIDPKRHQCGSCKSKLVQTKPVPRGGGEKKVSEYQVFVKENMSKVREENPGSPQKEIMGLVGKKYQEFKASRLGGGVKESFSVGVSEIPGSKERTPDNSDVGLVVRRLDFLDLTSP